jgi:hypothetical protein
MLAQAFVRDVFAAADQCVWAREIFQFGTQWECVLQDANDCLAAGALREQMLGAIFPICGGVTGDFTLDERELKAANSRGFAGAVDSGD